MLPDHSAAFGGQLVLGSRHLRSGRTNRLHYRTAVIAKLDSRAHLLLLLPTGLRDQLLPFRKQIVFYLPNHIHRRVCFSHPWPACPAGNCRINEVYLPHQSAPIPALLQTRQSPAAAIHGGYVSLLFRVFRLAYKPIITITSIILINASILYVVEQEY